MGSARVRECVSWGKEGGGGGRVASARVRECVSWGEEGGRGKKV